MNDKKKVPRHTLQDEELSVLLKALDYYVINGDAIGRLDYNIASKMAKELRNKAGWTGYSKPSTDEEDRYSEPHKTCEVCDD